MMAWALPIIYLLFCSLLLEKTKLFKVNGVSVRWIQLLFLMKCLAGLVLWWIYTYHYQYRDTSDAFRYFDDSMVILDLLKSDPKMFFRFMLGIHLEDSSVQPIFDQMHGWTSSYSYGIQNDNPTIIRINVLIGLLSFGHYHVHTVIMSFLSTMGIVFVLKALSRWNILLSKIFLVFMFTLPNLIFWSSGLLKEAPLILAMGVLIYGLNQLSLKKWKALIYLPIVVSFMFYLKGYVILSMMPAITFFGITLWVKRRWQVLTIGGIGLLLVWVLANTYYPAGDYLYVLQKKLTDFYNVAEMQNAGSVVEMDAIGSLSEYFQSIPKYLAHAYARPFWSEGDGMFYTICKIEILWFVGMVLFGVFGVLRAKDVNAFRLLCFGWLVLVVLGAIIGSTVPILGAVVRYKVPALFVFSICASFGVYELIKRWFPKRIEAGEDGL